MKKFLIYALRIISYITLPIGSYVAAWAIGIPSLTNFLKPIIPTSFAEEMAVIVVFIVLPILIIFFLRSQKELQALDNTNIVSKTFFGVIQRPTRRSLIVDLIPVVALIFIGLAPLIFWTVIFLMFIHAFNYKW